MAVFTPGTTVASSEPSIEVSLSADQALPVGRQTFRLVVTDDAGNLSQADEVTVIVADQEAPTAVLSAPRVVRFGQSFILDGSRSFDVGGGKVVNWQFTYVGPAV